MSPTSAASGRGVRHPSWPTRAARAAHRRWIHPSLDFVLPTDCIACGERLDAFQRMGVCSACWSAFLRVPRPSCSGCGLPRSRSSDLFGPARGRCATCLEDREALDAVRAVVVYDDRARSVVLEAKLGRRPELFRPLGDLMAADLRASGFAHRRFTLLPVPSHPWTNLRRGFGPANELARRISHELGLPLITNALRRRWLPLGSAKRLTRQGRLSFSERTFRIRAVTLPRRVLLVDDVMTTGATLRTCALALKSSGVVEVRALVWARALPSSWGLAEGR